METIKSIEQLIEQEHPLTDEQRRIIRDGGLAASFIGSEYWTLLIHRLEQRCREVLQDMFDCESSDDRVVANVWRRWKAAEKQRQDTENHFMALKDDYEAMQEQARQRQINAHKVPADDLGGISDI